MSTKTQLMAVIVALALVDLFPSAFGQFGGGGAFDDEISQMSPQQQAVGRERLRQVIQQISPQQRSEFRQIVMANRGNRPQMRNQLEQWAAQQDGIVQRMYQRYMELKANGRTPQQMGGIL